MRYFRNKFCHHQHLFGFWEAPHHWITNKQPNQTRQLDRRRAMSQQLQTSPCLCRAMVSQWAAHITFCRRPREWFYPLWGWEERERLEQDPPSPSLASRSWSEPPWCVPPAGPGWGWLVVGSPLPSSLSFCLLPSLLGFWEVWGAWEASGV